MADYITDMHTIQVYNMHKKRVYILEILTVYKHTIWVYTKDVIKGDDSQPETVGNESYEAPDHDTVSDGLPTI